MVTEDGYQRLNPLNGFGKFSGLALRRRLRRVQNRFALSPELL